MCLRVVLGGFGFLGEGEGVGVGAVGASGGGGPGEHSGAVVCLGDGPRCVAFEGVVPAAEVGEVGVVGFAAKLDAKQHLTRSRAVPGKSGPAATISS